MALVQMTAGGVYLFCLVVILAVIYLAVARFMDLNEKEPLWAVGRLFLPGVLAAVLLRLVGSRVLWGAVAEEATRFAAFVLGVSVARS